jgi:putative DNA methylase
MAYPIKSPRKLIEVALPLDKINDACAHEKMPGIGPHPRGIHLWWARRPLAAARSVIFAQMVNDPSWKWEMEHSGEVPPNHLKASWAKSRKRLFAIIEDLVKWENTDNEEVLERARVEIRNSWQDVCALNAGHPLHETLFKKEDVPSLHDPFSGGGAIPIEAERLGLKPYATDLNPVAVLINKAMIEIPPTFFGSCAVNPESKREKLLIERKWCGTEGLAEDIQYYGNWMRDEAKRLIGQHYPEIEITPELAQNRPDLQPYSGQHLKVITWIWARTVLSPNPAFSECHTPIIKSYKLATKGGEDFWIEPIVDLEMKRIRFSLKVGKAPLEKSGTIGRQGARCLFSNSPIALDYISGEGKAGRLGQTLIAIVADGKNGRIYLPPTAEHEQAAILPKVNNIPTTEIEHWVSCTNCVVYGLTQFEDLFTNRQMLALETFSTLLTDRVVKDVERHAVDAGFKLDNIGIANGGNQARAYAEAVATYLSFAISRTADFGNSLCNWSPSNQKVMHLFGKQAIPMVWDFCEANVLEKVVGGFAPSAAYIASCVKKLPSTIRGQALQADAQNQEVTSGKVVSTDPPYYDNVPYSNLSDFFYIWLRKSMINIYPELFKTIVVPRKEELVATATRHGGKENAHRFFLDGMTVAMTNIAKQAHPAVPITIYYAFKQSETTVKEGTFSPGWETPEALDEMTKGSGDERSPVAPVDLSQAIIGPGMAVFSKYAAVLEADGSPMSVRTALQLINRFLAEDDFDADTQFCLHWFEQHGWTESVFGEADVLAALQIHQRGRHEGSRGAAKRRRQSAASQVGRISHRLGPAHRRPHPCLGSPAPAHPRPETRRRIASGALLAALGGKAEAVRQLAYRLYTLCERLGQAEDARAYNELITSWTGIESAANSVTNPADLQGLLFEN